MKMPEQCIRKTITDWDKVFESGLSKSCGRQPLKNLHSPLLKTLSNKCILLNSSIYDSQQQWSQ